MGNKMLFHGCDVSAMAEKYGTPLYLMSEDDIRERFAEIRESFTEKYENTRAAYASKAFQIQEMMRIVQDEGMSLDVVSGGEIYAAMKAGVDPAVMVFHGNSKTNRELEEAVDAGVGTIVVDNESELERLNAVAERKGAVMSILLRLTPGVDSHTHSYISTGQLDSKFGIALEAVPEVITRAMGMKGIDMKGVHFHVGSQLMENDSHVMAVDIILDILADLEKTCGWTAREINCGGGFGVHYAGEPERVKLADFIDPMMEKINAFYESREADRPLITIEPGRWVVAEAGITVYEVGSVKTNGAGRTYAGIDGGYPDNPRVALYEAKYEVEAVEKVDQPHDVKTTIAGKCCESGDIIAYDVMLPPLEYGDHVAIMATGAYNYTMSSNYNKVGVPPVVMIRNGEDRLVVRRQTYDDMIANEL